jgi:hypothetical protein
MFSGNKSGGFMFKSANVIRNSSLIVFSCITALALLMACNNPASSNSGNPRPPAEYTITYNGNENSGGEAPADAAAYTEASTVIIKNNYGSLYKLVNENYMLFAGWNTDLNGEGTLYVPGQSVPMPSGGLVLYAQWIEDNTAGWCKLDYNMGDYDEGDHESGARTIAYESGETVYAAGLYTVIRKFYNFTGYNTEEDGTGLTIQPGENFDITSDTCLYAQWELDPDAVYVTVTYYGNGNTNDWDPETYMYFAGEEYSIQYNRYSKEQHGISCIFTGWNTEQNGSGTFYAQNDAYTFTGTETADMDLYAQWTVLGASGPGGGLVFYDKGNNDDGWRYLEAAPVISIVWYDPDPLSYVWSNRLLRAVLPTEISIGSGWNNTQIMLAWFAENTETSSPSANPNAAEAADAHSNNGKSDWYLPSISELEEMFTVLHFNGRGNFQTSGYGYYWSSSCSSTNQNNAYYYDFAVGQTGETSKGSNYRYRPIRRFAGTE